MGQHILQVLIEDQAGNAVPPTIEYDKPHTQYVVEIDKNHTATLIFDNEALQVLKDFKDVPLAELSEQDQVSFFKANFLNQDFDFGLAIEALKKGFKVARRGWNGADMFVYHVPAASYPASRNSKGTMLGMFPNDLVPYQAYIAFKTVQNTVVPWLASQTDILADDWYIVD